MWEHLQPQQIFVLFTLSFLLKAQRWTGSCPSDVNQVRAGPEVPPHRQHEVTGMMLPH